MYASDYSTILTWVVIGEKKDFNNLTSKLYCGETHHLPTIMKTKLKSNSIQFECVENMTISLNISATNLLKHFVLGVDKYEFSISYLQLNCFSVSDKINSEAEKSHKDHHIRQIVSEVVVELRVAHFERGGGWASSGTFCEVSCSNSSIKSKSLNVFGFHNNVFIW